MNLRVHKEIAAHQIIHLSVFVIQFISITSEALVSLLNFLILACKDSTLLLLLLPEPFSPHPSFALLAQHHHHHLQIHPHPERSAQRPGALHRAPLAPRRSAALPRSHRGAGRRGNADLLHSREHGRVGLRVLRPVVHRLSHLSEFFVDGGINERRGSVRAALRDGRNALDRVLLREICGTTR